MNENIFQIARQQVDLVKSVLGKRFAFEDNNTNEVQSGYTTYGTLETPTALIVVRLSNHICSMNNWATRYKPKLIANNKLVRRMGRNLQLPYKERCFFSVVFKAFDYTPNDVGNWKAICREYVFNPLEIEKSGTIGNICQDCLKLDSNENISINGQNPIDRIAKKSNNTENNEEIKENRNMNKKQTIRLNESQFNNLLTKIVAESVKKVLEVNDKHFPPSEGHPDIYVGGRKKGNRYELNYGADYGYKEDSSLLKNGHINPNAKRTEWMWIKDMVNHANDLFKEYHLHDEEAYEAIEKLHELLKQGIPESEAIDKVGDMFYCEN